MAKLTRLGELERAVMDHLWSSREPQTVRQVHETLSARRDLAYTTIMTVLQRLAKKNLVVQHRDDRAHRYAPTHGRDELVAGLMVDALDQVVGLGQPRGRTGALRRARRRRRGRRAAPRTGRTGDQAPQSAHGWQSGPRLRNTGSVSALAFSLSRCSSSGPFRRCWPERPGRCAPRGPRSCCGSPLRLPPSSRRSARESPSSATCSCQVRTVARLPRSPMK